MISGEGTSHALAEQMTEAATIHRDGGLAQARVETLISNMQSFFVDNIAKVQPPKRTRLQIMPMGLKGNLDPTHAQWDIVEGPSRSQQWESQYHFRGDD